MDVLKVVLDFVARSEWPLVAIGGIYLLRETLGRVAAGIISGKFEGWGFKGEFERKTELAELLLTPVDATPRTVPGPREPPALDTAGTLWNQLSPTGFVITAGNANCERCAIRWRTAPVSRQPKLPATSVPLRDCPPA
jgi:hypothetical protein